MTVISGAVRASNKGSVNASDCPIHPSHTAVAVVFIIALTLDIQVGEVEYISPAIPALVPCRNAFSKDSTTVEPGLSNTDDPT
jgi:hypothetical protein